MYKSKIDIDMHLFGKTLRQIMHDNGIKFTEFAADIQLVQSTLRESDKVRKCITTLFT